MPSSYSSDDEVPGWLVKLGLIVVILLIAVGGFFTFTTRVEAGYACASKRFGAVTGDAGPGLHKRIPGIVSYGCLNGRVQTLDIVFDPEKADSNATYVDVAINGKSLTGVTYAATLSLSYVVPLENVQTIYTKVGKTDQAVYQKGVLTPLRTITRQILNTHTADELYYGNLEALSAEVAAKLTVEMASLGLELRYFGLKEMDFDDSYEKRIQEKNAEIETAKQKLLQQETAKAEAERQRIEAEGNAAAQVISAQGTADSQVIAAQGAADSVEIAANAEAAANATIGASLAANPIILDQQRIEAINNANVIYLPSDTGVLPLLDISPSAQP